MPSSSVFCTLLVAGWFLCIFQISAYVSSSVGGIPWQSAACCLSFFFSNSPPISLSEPLIFTLSAPTVLCYKHPPPAPFPTVILFWQNPKSACTVFWFLHFLITLSEQLTAPRKKCNCACCSLVIFTDIRDTHTLRTVLTRFSVNPLSHFLLAYFLSSNFYPEPSSTSQWPHTSQRQWMEPHGNWLIPPYFYFQFFTRVIHIFRIIFPSRAIHQKIGCFSKSLK